MAGLYAAYVAGKKKGVPRPQAEWWGVPGQRGGARHTVEGCLGEHRADQLFAAQGHTKLNHGGQLVGLLDPSRGRGLDGVWQNATPPPDYLITETKYGKPKLSKELMSSKWVKGADRLERAVGIRKEAEIREAMRNGQVGRRLLNIDSAGELHVLDIDELGNILPLNTSHP